MLDWETGDQGYQGITCLVFCGRGRPGQVSGGVGLPVPQTWCDNSWPDLDRDGGLGAWIHK